MRWNGHKHPRLHATCQLQTPLVRRLQPHERESKPLLAPETQSTQWVWPEQDSKINANCCHEDSKSTARCKAMRKWKELPDMKGNASWTRWQTGWPDVQKQIWTKTHRNTRPSWKGNTPIPNQHSFLPLTCKTWSLDGGCLARPRYSIHWTVPMVLVLHAFSQSVAPTHETNSQGRILSFAGECRTKDTCQNDLL